MKWFAILMLFFSSCQYKTISKKNSLTKKMNETDNFFQFKISVKNLSEDATAISTQNDEILFLLYEYKENQNLPKLLIQDFSIFDKNNSSKEYTLEYNYWNKSLIYVLIEIDTDTPIDSIKDIITLNILKIITLKKDNQYLELKNILGDDDIIGLKEFKHSKQTKNKPIIFEGINLFDKYLYVISFSL